MTAGRIGFTVWLMLKTVALLAVVLGGCSLYADDGVAGGAAAIPGVEVGGVGEVAGEFACPPWWLSCSKLQLRQSECRTACTDGDRICAGYDAAACFDDCVAYRYEAYCPL